MEVPQNIGKYQIKYLISTLLERRLFLANDPEGNNVIIKESLNNQNEQLKQEFEILAKLNHPNIIKPIELITLNDKYYLILPRAENDLFEYMKSQTISDQTIHQIMHSLLSAVQYLNVLGIWHRNICPENILIFNNNNEKRFVLADFKNAINYTGTKNDEFRTKYQYMAPEISTNKGYTNKIDIWSCGVIMYQLYKHDFPYKDNSSPETDSLDVTDIPLTATDLISQMLCVDPEMRCSASEALNHHYFNKVH